MKNMRKTLNFMTVYEQSEDEQCLLENDDKAFDNYVDQNAPEIDPTVDEGEKSNDMDVSDVNSLGSRSCDEVDMPMRKRKKKLPKFDNFWSNTDLTNLIFKIGIRFLNVYVFRKAMRAFNKRKIRFSKNDKGTITKTKEKSISRQHINSESYKTIKAGTSIFYTIKAKTTSKLGFF
ncbi:hypothetical protein L3X38_041462 [Prunus dulcis]|uniref:Uncharacterized protein n=1 Tax=Prunus dulcis TaxID=3755 RepID=A0AAD4UUC5_PRUDU|nr:hypothetical protein L3X38_041462 [Prunus dulcis]